MSSEAAERAVRDGDLDLALSTLQDQIRKAPERADLRVFLFQLLCIQGQWARALNQLDVAAELDAATIPMVRALAARVDELMHSIRDKAPKADPTTIAVLACMHFAGQLRLAETELEDLRQRKDTRSGEYAAMLDRLINSVEELAI